jgi:hypothetical protein
LKPIFTIVKPVIGRNAALRIEKAARGIGEIETAFLETGITFCIASLKLHGLNYRPMA